MQDDQRDYGHRAREAMILGETNFPIWCDSCGTDAHIVVESARRPHWAPCNFLDVTYFCTKCNSLYGHLVKETDLDGSLMPPLRVFGNPPRNERLGRTEHTMNGAGVHSPPAGRIVAAS